LRPHLRARWHSWNGSQAYADTKLHDVLLAFGVARRWPDVLSNALTPGWVPTRMGGSGAPDDLDQAHLTQAWLATSDDPEARSTGRSFHNQRPGRARPRACWTACSMTAATSPLFRFGAPWRKGTGSSPDAIRS